MTPEEVLAFVAQHMGGDAGKALYGKTSKTIDNPLYGTPGHLRDPEKITVTVEQWKTPDGQVIFEGYRDPSSDQYVAIQQNTPRPPTPTAAQNAATAKGQKATLENGEMVTREIEADGSQGRIVSQRPATKAEIDNATPDPTSVSAASKKPVPGRAGIFEVSGTTKDKDGNTIADTHYEDAQGNTVNLDTSTTTSGRKPVPGKPGVWEVSAGTKDAQGNVSTDTHYEDDQGNRVPTPGTEGVSGSDRKPVPGRPGIYQVSNATKDAQGNSTNETHFEDEQGNRVATPTDPKENERVIDGQIYIRQPDGSYKKAQVEGAGGTAPQDVGALKAELGNVMPELEQRKNQYLQQHQANPTGFTMADVDKALESDRQMAQIRVNEVVGILNAQQNVRSQDVTQRGQTLGETQSRRTFADNTATAGWNIIKGLGPALGKQPPGAIDRIMDYVEQKQTGIAQRLGGLDLSPEIPHTPMQDALNQIPGSGIAQGPGGGITINIGAGAQAQQQSQAQQLAGLTDQVTATTNQMATPRQPGAADFAMLDPSQFANQTMPQNVDELIALHKKPNDPEWNDAIERAAQGIRNRNRDATPAGAGHQVSGGQLRAPGYSASNGPVGNVGG